MELKLGYIISGTRCVCNRQINRQLKFYTANVKRGAYVSYVLNRKLASDRNSYMLGHRIGDYGVVWVGGGWSRDSAGQGRPGLGIPGTF